jgi:2'-5' RNA ligase
MHVTLAFLGWTPDGQLDAVGEAARAAATGHGPFDLSFTGLGRFPASGRPRVVWLGVGEGAEPLAGLARAVTAELRARALNFDERPFAPHLTLARVREEASGPEARTVAAAVDAIAVPDLRTRVERIAVVESVLSPKGPSYTTRLEIPLSGGSLMGRAGSAPTSSPRPPP